MPTGSAGGVVMVAATVFDSYPVVGYNLNVLRV